MSRPTQCRLDGLRHSAVPKLLALHEAPEIRIITAGFALLLAAPFMVTVDRQQIIEISGTRRSRWRYTFALILRNAGKTFCGNCSPQTRVDIKRYHWHLIHPRKAEQRQVEVCIRAPNSIPI